MRHQRPDNFGRKDSPIEYDQQGKPRLPAPMRTGYAAGGFAGGGGSTFGPVQLDDPGLSGAGQLASALGVMQSAGYGPASRGGGFDADYYLRNNPGVEDAARALGMDPYQGAYTHYDLYGRREGRLGSAPRADATAAAAPQSTLANLTPVGGGGAAPVFNANADLAAQQATGAATLAQMRGSGPGPAAPAAPAAPRPSFMPTAGANATPPVAMAGGGAVEDPQFGSKGVQYIGGGNSANVTSGVQSSGPYEKIPTRAESERRHQFENRQYLQPMRLNPIDLRDRSLHMAGGGLVEELGPRQMMDPQSMIPPGGGGPALNRFGMNRGRAQMKRGYAQGGDVSQTALDMLGPEAYEEWYQRVNRKKGDSQPTDDVMLSMASRGEPLTRGYAQGGEVDDQNRAEDTYVTGDQLAKQVEERFSQALETDDKYRRGYDDGGYIPQEGAATGYDPAAAEEARRIQEEIERQRMAEAAVEAQREAARQPAPEQAPPADERRTDRNDTSRPLPEPPALPPEQSADGVPSPAQPAAVADAQAQAEQQTNDWLAKVIDYSHSKVDPAEYGPPAPPAARTGYAPEETGGGRGPLMANMLPAMASMLAPGAAAGATTPPDTGGAPVTPAPGAGPATPPEQGATVSPTAGWGELIGAGLKKAGQAIAHPFVQGAEPRSVSRFSPTMTIAEMLNGKDANYNVEQLHQLREQDPRGDYGPAFQRLADKLQAEGNLEEAHKLSQSMRNPYAGLIATAQASNAARNPEATARLLDQAHNFLTNKTTMKTVPTESGFDITLTSEVDGTSQQRSLTPDQMTDFLNKGTQYDALAKNSTLKQLDIAAGRRGQLDIDIGKLPVSDEHTGYTPQEPPMTPGAPRTSDFTTVPPPAAGGAAAAAPAGSTRTQVPLDPEVVARATAHIPAAGTPASSGEKRRAITQHDQNDFSNTPYVLTPDQLQAKVEEHRKFYRDKIVQDLQSKQPYAGGAAPGPANNANPLTPMTMPLKSGYNQATDIGTAPVGGKPRHPAWEGLAVADKWESGKGYQAPEWPNKGLGPENYGMFSRASGPAQSGITLGRNEGMPSVGPYIPAGGDQGALRIPPNGQAPPGWRTFPAEDAHEGSGRIALPPGASPTVKDVTMYNGAGQPVPMKVPDFWDPNKIKYSNEGRSSGEAVFPNPPGTKFNQQGDAVRPISSYASTLATPAPGRGPGAPAPIARGGSDFTGPQPWQPTYGPGTAGVPPPAGDTSSDAVAARRNPATSQAGNRAKEAMALDALASKETNAETAAAGRVGAADVTGQYRTAATGMQQAGAKERTGMQQTGAMDRTQANIAGRATAASQKFEDDMAKLEAKEGHIDKRAAARDLTNRYKIDTISSDVGRKIAQQALDHQQQQFLSTYRTKLANGMQPDAQETAAYETFKGEVARQGFRVPPDDQAPAPAPAQAAPAAQAPAPGRGRLTVPPRGGVNTGAAVNETARGLAGGQATAASATPPGQQPAGPGQQWLTNPRTGEVRLAPIQ